MKHAETIKISIPLCWLHLLYSLCTLYRRIPTNDDVLSRLTICVKTWSPVWNRHYVYNFCPGINDLIKYTYLDIHGETYWFLSRYTGIIFSKKVVNCNHYINLLKVRFKVYKMCTLKETFRKVFDSNGSTSYARIYINSRYDPKFLLVCFKSNKL